jgi:hypothetical protein
MLGWRTMRMIWSSRFWRGLAVCVGVGVVLYVWAWAWAHLEALVLQHALNGRIFAAGRQLGLEDDTKGAVADNLALRVGEVLVFARLAVLDLFADDFWGVVSGGVLGAGAG